MEPRVESRRGGVLGGRNESGLGDIQPQHQDPSGDGRSGEQVAQRAVQWVNPRAALGRVRFDVRDGVRFDRIEARVRPRGGARQRKLQERAQQPEDAHYGASLRCRAHAGTRTSFRRASAPRSTSPYMQTMSGPVGRSPASDNHRPKTEASAPEPHEM